MNRNPSNRGPLIAYGVTVLIVSLNAIGIRYIVQELAPFWGATLRFFPAALILLATALLMRRSLPRGRAFLGAVIFGLLNFGGSYAFLYYGIQKVQPGMMQVILALVPLFTLLATMAHRQEQFRWRSLFGALLALAGVAVVFWEQISANVPFFFLLTVVLGAVCFSEATVIAKSFPRADPIATNAVGMGAGGLLLFGLALLFHEPIILPHLAITWWALAYLVVPGSCLAFVFLLYDLKTMSASATSYQFVMIPFFTLSASAWLTHERLNPILLVGAVLVLAGVLVGVIRPRRKLEPAPAESAPVTPAPVTPASLPYSPMTTRPARTRDK